MKSYDETINTVFDRIHTYQVKKQKRTAITRRIAASCCAVSLLGGGVWYVNRHPMDTPIKGIATGDNTTTTNASDTVPTSPTTTNPTEDKIIITADEPDNYGLDTEDLLCRDQKYISTSLQNEMDKHQGTDVAYAVWVSILMTGEDIFEFPETDKELVQLAAESELAYSEYQKILERDNPSGPHESGKWVHSEEAKEKREIWLSIKNQYNDLRDQLWEQYSMSIVNNRIEKLTVLSLTEPAHLSQVDGYSPINTACSTAWKGYAYSAVLTTDAINELAEDGGYMFLLASPTEDYENLLHAILPG